MTTEVL